MWFGRWDNVYGAHGLQYFALLNWFLFDCCCCDFDFTPTRIKREKKPQQQQIVYLDKHTRASHCVFSCVRVYLRQWHCCRQDLSRIPKTTNVRIIRFNRGEHSKPTERHNCSRKHFRSKHIFLHAHVSGSNGMYSNHSERNILSVKW